MAQRDIDQEQYRKSYLEKLAATLRLEGHTKRLFDLLLGAEKGLRPTQVVDELELENEEQVRSVRKRLADRIERFNQKFGEDLGVELILSESPYRFTWQVAAKKALIDSDSALRTFWEPYLQPRRRVVLMVSTPLFWRYPNGRRYLRDFDRNDPADPPGTDLTESYHYLSVGDVWSVFQLTERFQRTENAVAFKHVKAREWKPAQSKGQRVIAVGNSRNNEFIRKWQARCRIRVEPGHVIDSNGIERTPEYYGNRIVEYAVVTRFRDEDERIVTILASNHGTATFAAAEYLTSEEKIQEMFESCSLTSLPEKFQILFKVEVFVQDLYGRAELEDAIWDG